MWLARGPPTFGGFRGFWVYVLTEPLKRTYEIQMTYVVIGSFSHELQMIYVAGAGTADVMGFEGFRCMFSHDI